jgi:Putative MetA-pathway of phenol degradation
MRCHICYLGLTTFAIFAGGCASLPSPTTTRAQAPTDAAEKAKDAAEAKDDKAEPPKTVFEWAIGPPVEKKEDDGEQPLVTDRPDFTEASTTVGQGRVQLEAGFTYTRDRTGGSTRIDRSFPEALLRIGAFADWFELRIAQNYNSSRTSVGVPTESLAGRDDLYLGTKLALTEQRAYLPELAIIFQTTVPTGAATLTEHQVLPGINFLFGWDIIKDVLDCGGSFQANRAIDGDRHPYIELAQSFTIGYGLTSKLGAYTEWYALYPTGTTAPGTTAQHYFDGGFTYKFTPNFQLDVRVGWGLTKSADDFFAGTGFSVRY